MAHRNIDRPVAPVRGVCNERSGLSRAGMGAAGFRFRMGLLSRLEHLCLAGAYRLPRSGAAPWLSARARAACRIFSLSSSRGSDHRFLEQSARSPDNADHACLDYLAEGCPACSAIGHRARARRERCGRVSNEIIGIALSIAVELNALST